MTPPLALEDAQARLLDLIGRLKTDEVALADASGRFLATDLRALRDQPRADLSAMDGFALAGTGPWLIVGESRAGLDFAAALTRGEAVRISTGAALPAGADRILMIEDALVEGDTLATSRPLPGKGQHIRRHGFDFAAGNVLLAKGTRLGPAQFALALAGGHERATVGARPRLTIIDSGDELLAEGPARLPASNARMLAALCHGLAATTMVPPPVPDRLDSIRAAISAADTDIVVTTGGASVGEHDLIRPALEAEGYALDFWRVAVRPGKPLLVAHKDGQLVLGLPGNPVSAFVTGVLFLLPLLRAWAGARAPFPSRVPLLLARDMSAGGERREFVRGQLIDGYAAPLPERDSSALAALARAELLIDRPAHAPETKAGTPVPCILLGNGGIA